MKGEKLPEADLVYLPGGYPELFAFRLQRHRRLMTDLKRFAESGGRILAECGGMIYLSQGLRGSKGNKKYDFCGILPFECSMENARLHWGIGRLSMHRETIGGDMSSIIPMS